MPQPDLGTKLRALRSDRGHSIAEVAEATGISASFLSLVENGRSDIAIGRLMRLIGFYGVGLSTLFPEAPDADVDVLRSGEYHRVALAEKGIELALLARDGGRAMTPFLGAYAPGAGMAAPMPQEGEVFVIVLEGTVGIDFEDGEAIELAAGDTAYIRSHGRRAYRNAGEGTARLLGVIARPAGS